MRNAMASVAAQGLAQDAATKFGRTFSIDQSSLPDAQGGINWNQFNYPPLIRVIHYDINELPTSVTSLVRLIWLSWILTFVGCSLNLLDTFIIQGWEDARGVWILWSLLNFLIFVPFAFYTFFVGYKGLAVSSSDLCFRFKILQTVACLVYLLLALVPWGCTNGYTTLNTYNTVSGWWSFAVITESTIFLLNFLIAAVNIYRVHTFNPFATTSTNGPTTGV